MSKTERPLSPHLSIYRWPITMTLSILHRATGVAMSVGFGLLVWWLAVAADGPDAYATVTRALGSAIGQILLIAWTWAFFYHLANGIRHLVWDTGRGFDKRQATASAWLVLAASVVLTGIVWVLLR